MTSAVQLLEVENVATKLSQAWLFLSGEERHFEWIEQQQYFQRLQEFNFFMPLEVKAEGRTGGVAVFIPRHDALRVAANMFDLAPTELEEADLKDACAEVCNVFSDCIVMHVCGNEDVSIGLPCMADSQFLLNSQNSAISAIYQSNIELGNLIVIVYDVLRQPS
jgi:hypothetical protein